MEKGMENDLVYAVTREKHWVTEAKIAADAWDAAMRKTKTTEGNRECNLLPSSVRQWGTNKVCDSIAQGSIKSFNSFLYEG